MGDERFSRSFNGTVLLLDGAMGTELQRLGRPADVCPELWAVENEHLLERIHSAYCNAGSDVVTTNTFGANRIKLSHFGLAGRTAELNRRNTASARKAAGEKRFVAGSVGPLGRLVEPSGDLSFDEAYDVFREQVIGLAEGGCNIILIETMLDLQEARCALLAAKDACDLPVWVSMTFEDDRTLTGSDPVTVLVTLQAMGADAVGTNCGNGPRDMIPLIEAMAPHAAVPILVQPNAGIPRTDGDNALFTLLPDDFASFVKPLYEAGATLIGACCGSTPDTIRAMAAQTRSLPPHRSKTESVSGVTSLRKTVFLGPHHPIALIGDQLNPSGRKKLTAELAQGDMTLAREIGVRMDREGADIINVNVGVPLVDQTELMTRIVRDLSVAVTAPLSIDSADTTPIVEAVKRYPGRALINSISGEEGRRKALLPVVKRYGSMFVLMPLNAKGIPSKAEGRLSIIREVVDEAVSLGIPRSAIVVDGLVLSEATNPGGAGETLRTIRACVEELGLLAMCGLSNVSYGLPQRGWMDGAFLAMCAREGIGAVNGNPGSVHHRSILRGCDVLTGRDPHAMRYLRDMGATEAPPVVKAVNPSGANPEEALRTAVKDGDSRAVERLVETVLASGRSPLDIVNGALIPAITDVGERFSRKEVFLPQLMLSAAAAQAAFSRLERELKGAPMEKKGTVLLATVKGDIHDIGKNLVAVLLKNSGFNVVDLGIDVPAEAILDNARQLGADVIGLSSLMTTTMASMRETIRLVRESGLGVPVIVGGAVLNDEYARTIGADGYGADAVAAVKLATKVVVERKARR